MKYWLILLLFCSLILGITTVSWASFLFEPEVGLGSLQVDDSSYPADQAVQMFYLNNNVDIFLVRLGLEAGYANGNPYDFLNLGAGVTLRFPIGGFKLLGAAGYQGFIFKHDQQKFSEADSFWGTLLGGGVEIPIIDALSLNAIYYYPVTRKYYRGAAFVSNNISEVDMEYYKVSLYYNLPLLDIFLNFRGIGAGYQSKQYASYSYSLGCKIGF